MGLFKKRNFIAAGMTLIVMVAVGFVYAAWTTNGSGSGYAKAGTSQALSTVDISATTTASLYPGVSGDVYLRIHNPNPYAVTVTDVVGSGTITADASHSGCSPTGVTFTDQTGKSIAVTANGNTDATLTGAASMSSSSVDACKGATFTIPVNITGASS